VLHELLQAHRYRRIYPEIRAVWSHGHHIIAVIEQAARRQWDVTRDG